MNTVQEQAWRGDLGNAYNVRSPGDEEANRHLFMRALWRQVDGYALRSIVELGAGTGANLRALGSIFPEAYIDAVEINADACERLRTTAPVQTVHQCSVLEWEPEHPYHLVLTKGLLIHIPPDYLGMVYEVIHRAALRWILISEYYNPTPVGITYRGEEDRLWKRDFAGEMLDRYPDLRLVEYGFVYKRDAHPQDDLTWFLLEKNQ